MGINGLKLHKLFKKIGDLEEHNIWLKIELNIYVKNMVLKIKNNKDAKNN